MPRPHLTFFVELASEPLARLFSTPGVIDYLARERCAISMGILDLSVERASIVRELEARGVPVTAWLLLDVAQGYWLNADNPQHGRARYEETVAWAAGAGLTLHRIGLDIEFPRSDADMLMRRGVRGVFTLLRRRRRAQQVLDAERAYAELIGEIRRGGRVVESYHFPHILDERAAGTTLLRRTFGLVDVPVDVDVFMLYSSYLGRIGACAYFADAGTIAVGVTGGGVNAGTAAEAARVLTWERFEADLLAAAAHAREVYIFSLEGCVEQDMLPRLAGFDWNRLAPPLSPGDARRASGQRWLARTVLRSERLLDVVFPSRVG